jgi:hypothetical protein
MYEHDNVYGRWNVLTWEKKAGSVDDWESLQYDGLTRQEQPGQSEQELEQLRVGPAMENMLIGKKSETWQSAIDGDMLGRARGVLTKIVCGRWADPARWIDL